MLATMPQNRSGRCVMKSGPGWMPWMTSAPSSSAVTGLPGMPSESTGIMPPADRGVVGGFRARHAFDRALAEALGSLAMRFSSA